MHPTALCGLFCFLFFVTVLSQIPYCFTFIANNQLTVFVVSVVHRKPFPDHSQREEAQQRASWPKTGPLLNAITPPPAAKKQNTKHSRPRMSLPTRYTTRAPFAKIALISPSNTFDTKHFPSRLIQRADGWCKPHLHGPRELLHCALYLWVGNHHLPEEPCHVRIPAALSVASHNHGSRLGSRLLCGGCEDNPTATKRYWII